MLAQHVQRVGRDHQLLVGWYDIAGNARPLAGNLQLARCVRLRGKLEAEPRESLYHRRANGRRVLADARGKHEAIDAAHGGSKHSCEERNPVDEIVRALAWRMDRARKQLPYVVTDARQALEPTVIVEKALNGFRSHPFLAHEVEHNAGVELPRPCAHRAVHRAP